MITREEAEAIVARREPPLPPVQVGPATEEELGWLVPVRGVEGGLIGSGPTFVSHDGEVFLCGGMQPWSVSYEDIRVMLRCAGLLARLRHRWRVFNHSMVVTRVPRA